MTAKYSHANFQILPENSQRSNDVAFGFLMFMSQERDSKSNIFRTVFFHIWPGDKFQTHFYFVFGMLSGPVVPGRSKSWTGNYCKMICTQAKHPK